MSAADVAVALGAARRAGTGWKCRCPCCGGRLALGDGTAGRLLWHCWGGCDGRDVLADLRRLGYLSGDTPRLAPEEIARRRDADERKRRAAIARARELWSEGGPIADTLADRCYLRAARGVDIRSPLIDDAAERVLRYHPRAWHSAPGIYRPALLAKIEHVEHGFIGCHATYLAMDGSGKTTLDPPRKIWGAAKGGAVRLGEPKPDQWLVICEGVETTLAVMVACSMPGWAALSANGIQNLALPDAARMVVICADNDRNGVGQRAAKHAAQRFLAEGRRCRVFMPPVPNTDWNDVLRGRAPARCKGASHAA